MSIDVFGRKLRESRLGSDRGPPGFGYKLTGDGQFDIENKRLCNLATPNQGKDAVNLETLQRIIQMETLRMIEITTKLRRELDDLNTITKVNQDEIDSKFASINSRLERIQESLSWSANDKS